MHQALATTWQAMHMLKIYRSGALHKKNGIAASLMDYARYNSNQVIKYLLFVSSNSHTIISVVNQLS
jgi:succinate dehydrogenase hydrophobic anchor subunit